MQTEFSIRTELVQPHSSKELQNWFGVWTLKAAYFRVSGLHTHLNVIETIWPYRTDSEKCVRCNSVVQCRTLKLPLLVCVMSFSLAT